MKAVPAMRPGALLPLTLLLSFVLQTAVWFCPEQATFVSDVLGKTCLPLEWEWIGSKNASSRIMYAFGNLMLVVGFLQTLVFVIGKGEHTRRPRPGSRMRQILGLLSSAAMLVGINFGLAVEMAGGMLPASRIDMIQIIGPSLSLGAGILLAGALLTCLPSSHTDPI